MKSIVPNYQAIVASAFISGAFSIIVCCVLVVVYCSHDNRLAMDDPQYAMLQLRQAKEPENADLKAQLRVVDLRLRDDYFRRLTFARRGALLLAGGVVITLLLAHWASLVRRRLPDPQTARPVVYETRQQQLGQVAAIVFVVIIASVVFGSRHASLRALPSSLAEWDVEDSAKVATPRSAGSAPDTSSIPAASSVRQATESDAEIRVLPTAEQWSASWPRFRGPRGAGVSAFTDVPETWNGATGQGILWKTAIDHPGMSSPIVWQERIFLTGATSERCEVSCFATNTGKLLWRKQVGENALRAAALKVDESTGFAAPTPTTDGQRVYALFASGDLVALDFAGNEVWSYDFGVLENPYGHASSLEMHQDLLIVQVDQGSRAKGISKLLALRAATGEVVWETARPVGASWSSPIAVEYEGQSRIITCADPWVIAYNTDDGTELWRAECLRGDVAPSPVYANGVVYVANDQAEVAAIRDGGTGDVTESHILWSASFGLPDICSPLVTSEHVLTIASYGALVCYDRERGGDEPLWEEDLVASFTASPSLVGDRVYLISDEGQCLVLQPHDGGVERISQNDLGELCFTGPAFQQGCIYIRGEEHLFCIGNP